MAEVEAKEIKIRHVDFYPTDWLEGTISLSHIERSVYITICAAIYAQGGPVEISHVRKLCAGRGFEQGLGGLIAKGKATRVGTLLRQERCIKEVERAQERVAVARMNGSKGSRNVKDLAKPPGLSLGSSSAAAQKKTLNTTGIKKDTSSVGKVSVRASSPNGGATHAHDGETVNWKPLGNVVPPADAPPPPPMDAKIKRAGEHYFFLLNHGRPGEAVKYLEMLDASSQLPPDEIFNTIEARMTTA
jgi:hypothetical protein